MPRCDAGMARFTCHDPHNVYDVIPCDLVASGILVAACALTQVRALCAPKLMHTRVMGDTCALKGWSACCNGLHHASCHSLLQRAVALCHS